MTASTLEAFITERLRQELGPRIKLAALSDRLDEVAFVLGVGRYAGSGAPGLLASPRAVLNDPGRQQRRRAAQRQQRSADR